MSNITKNNKKERLGYQEKILIEIPWAKRILYSEINIVQIHVR
jgi:hypothetical protein